jgi:hypothetical protein
VHESWTVTEGQRPAIPSWPCLLHQANSNRFNNPTPDLGATAYIVFGGLEA